MKILRFVSLILVPIFTVAMLTYVEDCKAETIETDKYILYIPDRIDERQKYPLVIEFCPRTNAKEVIGLWKNIAEKHNLIIAVSKEFRVGIDPKAAFSTMVALIRRSDSRYSIDKSRIIISGFSNGGMAAHMFSVLYPDFTWAVISNCGGIRPDYIQKRRHFYTRNKLAVFLSSATDYNSYRHMVNDSNFLNGLGWKIEWIEFKGGHTIAPEESYEKAVEWLESQMSK